MNSEPIHFKFLDAFRGMMALFIVVNHSSGHLGYTDDFARIIIHLTSGLGMSGFFLLSSFLLTYRLYDEMDKIASVNYKQYTLVIGKYFIRRFMRIYLVYFVYCTFFCFVYALSTGIFLVF